jgi:hypothetical protein
MANVERPKAKPKPRLSYKEQYKRFKETAREHGVDDAESSERFESVFKRIVASGAKSRQGKMNL